MQVQAKYRMMQKSLDLQTESLRSKNLKPRRTNGKCNHPIFARANNGARRYDLCHTSLNTVHPLSGARKVFNYEDAF